MIHILIGLMLLPVCSHIIVPFGMDENVCSPWFIADFGKTM